MSVETRLFDPNGDVLLIFPHNEEDTTTAATAAASAEPVTTGDESVILPAVTTTFHGALQRRGSKPPICQQPECLKRDPQKDVHMLVSSKHMTLASTVFAAMLSVHFREGSELHSRGKAEITLPDDDPDAFTILLDIIHGHSKKVPRQVDLMVLTDLAVLVDKYQLLEAVDFFSTTWMGWPGTSISRASADDLFLWLCISWVFKSSLRFTEITQLLMRTGERVIGADPEDELPIPETILNEINTRRQKAISGALDVAYSLMENHQSGGYCKRTDGRASACDAMLLGSLLRGCQKAALWPPPAAPYEGLSFDDVAIKICSISIQTLCGTMNEVFKHHGSGKFITDMTKPPVKGEIDDKIISLGRDLSGIAMEHFLSENART